MEVIVPAPKGKNNKSAPMVMPSWKYNNILGAFICFVYFFPSVFFHLKSRKSMHEYNNGDSSCCLPGCTGSSAVFVSLRSRHVFGVCETTVDSQTNTSAVWVQIVRDVLLGNLKFTVSLCSVLRQECCATAASEINSAPRPNTASLSSRMFVKHFCILIKGHILHPANWFS